MAVVLKFAVRALQACQPSDRPMQAPLPIGIKQDRSTKQAVFNSALSPCCAATYGETLKMGLLQLAGVLIRVAAPQLVDHRKASPESRAASAPDAAACCAHMAPCRTCSCSADPVLLWQICPAQPLPSTMMQCHKKHSWGSTDCLAHFWPPSHPV